MFFPPQCGSNGCDHWSIHWIVLHNNASLNAVFLTALTFKLVLTGFFPMNCSTSQQRPEDHPARLLQTLSQHALVPFRHYPPLKPRDKCAWFSRCCPPPGPLSTQNPPRARSWAGPGGALRSHSFPPHLTAPPAAAPCRPALPASLTKPGLAPSCPPPGDEGVEFSVFRLAERRRREPFLCAGRRRGAPRPRSRLSPAPRKPHFCHSLTPGTRALKITDMAGETQPWQGFACSLMACSLLLSARLQPRAGPRPRCPRPFLPRSPRSPSPRSPRAALQQGPEWETPCARASGRGEQSKRKEWGTVTPSMVQYPSALWGKKVVPRPPDVLGLECLRNPLQSVPPWAGQGESFGRGAQSGRIRAFFAVAWGVYPCAEHSETSPASRAAI